VGRVYFFAVLGVLAFGAWSYIMFLTGKLRAWSEGRKAGTWSPHVQQKLLRDASRVMQQVTTVSSLDSNFTILNDRDRTAIEGWMSKYERESR
jgi:hypothetical protein